MQALQRYGWMACVLTVVAAAAAAGFESLDELMGRYQAYVAPLRTLPRHERSEQALAFFYDVSWDQIRYLCLKNSPGVRPGSEGAQQDLVKSKLHAEGVALTEMADFLDDPRICLPCQRAIVSYVGHIRQDLRDKPEAEVLAGAFLRRADLGDLERPIVFVLEKAAAYLSDRPELMARMSAHCRSGDVKRIEHGLLMLGDSKSGAAGDTLIAMTEYLLANGVGPKQRARVMDLSAQRAGSGAFALLQRIYETTPDDDTRQDALKALAATQDQRSHPLLLAAYGDAVTGIMDASNTIADRDKRRFYNELWMMVRAAEPGLKQVLETGSESQIAVAIELVDRQSRHGVPRDREGVMAALEACAAGAGSVHAERIGEILARFRSYPDRRAGTGR